jgi:hypothetical protein
MTVAGESELEPWCVWTTKYYSERSLFIFFYFFTFVPTKKGSYSISASCVEQDELLGLSSTFIFFETVRYLRYGILAVEFGLVAGITVMWPIFVENIDADDLQGLCLLGLLMIGSFIIIFYCYRIIVFYWNIITVTLQTAAPSPTRGSRGYAYPCSLLTWSSHPEDHRASPNALYRLEQSSSPNADPNQDAVQRNLICQHRLRKRWANKTKGLAVDMKWEWGRQSEWNISVMDGQQVARAIRGS